MMEEQEDSGGGGSGNMEILLHTPSLPPPSSQYDLNFR